MGQRFAPALCHDCTQVAVVPCVRRHVLQECELLYAFAVLGCGASPACDDAALQVSQRRTVQWGYCSFAKWLSVCLPSEVRSLQLVRLFIYLHVRTGDMYQRTQAEFVTVQLDYRHTVSHSARAGIALTCLAKVPSATAPGVLAAPIPTHVAPSRSKTACGCRWGR